MPDGGDDGNNGIDIVPADLNPAEPSFHYRPEQYEQWEFAGCDGDDRLLLKMTARVGNNPELVTSPAEVVHVNGAWQLKRRPPMSPRPYRHVLIFDGLRVLSSEKCQLRFADYDWVAVQMMGVEYGSIQLSRLWARLVREYPLARPSAIDGIGYAVRRPPN